MNKKVLTICLSVLVISMIVWVAGCEKKADTPVPAGAKACGAGCTKPCCADKAATCSGDKTCAAGANAKACPAGCTKPCCAATGAEAKKCAPGCTKPCCAAKTATDAVKEAAQKCCGADPTKCCGAKAAEAVEKAAGDVKDAIDAHAGHNHDHPK